MQASELSTVIMPRSFRLMLQSLVVLCCLVLVPGARAEAKLEAFPSGTPARGPISVVYAIYYANAPSSEPMAALKDALVREGGTIKLVKALSKTPAEPQVEATLDPASQNGYAPPDLQAIQYFGRGLSREQAEAVQLSRLALVLEFARPVDTTFASLRAADSLVLRVAEQTGGLLWDEETREIFTPDEWRKRRIDSWRGDIPDVVKHTVIHAYQGDKLVRAITLGMRKFGLPEERAEKYPDRHHPHPPRRLAPAPARRRDSMASVLPHTARQFARAIVMPNLKPPVTTTAAAEAYREPHPGRPAGGDEVRTADDAVPDQQHAAGRDPRAQESGIVHAVKLYPAGATTNSDAGVTDLSQLLQDAGDDAGSGHAAPGPRRSHRPDIDLFDREAVFIERVMRPLRRDFPELKIVFEHITTKHAAQYVAEAEGPIAATITAHHLLYNRNEIFKGGIVRTITACRCSSAKNTAWRW
jgi:hypothetical protein